MLINSAELLKNLGDPSWVIFDCRHDLMDHAKGAKLYQESHLPLAHFAPVETALSGPKTGTNGRHPLPNPEAFTAFLAAHGVTSKSTVVAYDDAGGLYAARLWWLARWIGLKSVCLLDGGMPRWLSDGGKLTVVVPPKPTAPGTLRTEENLNMVWNAAKVQGHIRNPACALVDARAPERFRGDIETIDPVAGHIPGALNRFYKNNLHEDLTFRPANELNAEFRTLFKNGMPDYIVHQCGSGITACANVFAMEYAGLTGSKLFPGSWSEWIADPSRPVARGGAN